MITFHADRKVFHLRTAHTGMLISLLDGVRLYSAYYGKRLREDADLTRLWQVYPSGFSPNYEGAPDARYSLDLIPTEYPAFGHGDFRSPAVEVIFPNGGTVIDPVYCSHEIVPGGTEPPGLPGLSGGDQTLKILLRDRPTGLQIRLYYTVYEQTDIIARRAEIVNATGAPVRLERAMSLSMDLPIGGFDLIGLYGSHIRERQIDRTPLRHGTQSVGSRRGASSHQHNPFLAFARPNADEQSGEVYAMALVYSGNWLGLCETDSFGGARVQMGIHPDGFSWLLEPGERFVTPQAVITYSDAGFGEMSRRFHRVFCDHLGHGKTRRRRPIVINSWEATYFDFDEHKLLNIIESCRGLGIDTFVLDDGWFGRRDDDTGSLGDWFVHPGKLPHGLKPLCDKCAEQGMDFGLWFEPEMVSPDSELYRAHPDWALGEPGRPLCLGRNQLVLDLTRGDVIAYLEEAIGSLLRENRIAYVKWDMNRHLTDVYSSALPADRQGEVCHRYVLGLYRLMGDLAQAFPQVTFEGCSGGGGRFDAGVLYYQPQIWTSDNSDAIERLKIQYGTSLCYPPQCMTAHLSASPNHQMGRVTPMNTRALVSMSASFGYELNPLLLTEEERAQIKAQTAMYREISDIVVFGDFYRLINPFTENACAWMFVLPDKSRAFAVYVRQLAVPADPRNVLKCQGLDPSAVYRVRELGAEFGGDELMYAGLAIPPLLDFEAVSYTLEKI